MRIAALALLALAGCGQVPAATRSAPDAPTFVSVDAVGFENGRGVYTANRDGRITRIDFALPLGRVDAERLHMGDRLGETKAGVVVMVDEYATRTASETARCAEGTESFVRVFSLPLRRELLAVPLESCLDGKAAPVPAATWTGPDRFRIETEPKRTYVITGADRVAQLGV